MAVPIGAVVGGLTAAKGLFGGSGSTPTFNTANLERAVQQGRKEQGAIISRTRPQLKPLGEQFKTDLASAIQARRTQGATGRETFLKGVSGGAGEQAELAKGRVKQDVLSTTPELRRQILEGQAATGGIQRGSTTAQLGQLTAQQAAAVAGGVADIEEQRLNLEQQARETVFMSEERELQEVLGLDSRSLELLLSQGRQDIINEAASLLEESRSATANQLAIAQIQSGAQFGEQAAERTRRDLLNQALVGAGGQILGQSVGSRGKGVQEVQPAQQPAAAPRFVPTQQ